MSYQQPGQQPFHSLLIVRVAALTLLATTVVGSWTSGAAGQTAGDGGAADAVVVSESRIVAVDATGETVAIELIGLDSSLAVSSVALEVEGETVDVASVATTDAEGRTAEVVLLVDAHVRGRAGNVVQAISTELKRSIAAMPADTSIAVVSAGDGALTLARPTTDRAKIESALDSVALRNSSALYSAVGRAAQLFSDDPTTVKSLIVVSTGPDDGSAITANEGRVALLQHGAQLISIAYPAGDSALDDIADQTAGLAYTVATQAGLRTTMAHATAHATYRSVVRFDPAAEPQARSSVSMSAGEREFAFSFPADVRTVNPLQLLPEPETGSATFVLFRTSLGLYLALGLAFIGISLGVWSLGSIVAGGEGGLEGMLAHYTERRVEASDTEVEELVVQSALLQRAVMFSESFAERRGFLARSEELLEKANLPIRAGEAMFVLSAVVFLSASLGLVVTRSLIAAVLFGALAGGLSFFIVRFLGRRRFKTFESQLPDTLQLLSGTLRAGYSLPQGLEAVSHEIADPMGQELRRALTEARLGREMEDCLNGVADRMASPDFAWTVMAIGIQREVGGNLNELLMSVAETMMARDRLKREVSALTAEGKMSAGVLSFLPPGLGLVMWAINPDYIALLFTERMGNVLLGLGLVSGTLGLTWMKKVITIDV